MQTSVLSTLLLAACVRAIEINSPTKNDVVDLASGVKVTWSTVASDPKTAHLFLVNMAGGHTPYSKDLGEVDLSKGSITVTESVKDDTTYQFNFQSMKENNMGILAQSEQFEAKADEGKKEETTTKSTAATTTKATVASGASETAEATTLSSVVVSASGSSASGAASKTASSASTGTTANASSTPESGAAGRKVGGVLALVAGIVAVIA